MPPASGCITSRLRSSFCIFRIISRRCLRFISCQWCCVGWLVALLFCSSGLDFMLTFLCRIQLGSARLAKTTQSRQRGRAVLLFRTTPAAIYTIARTGAMLLIGQEHTSELQSRLHLVCRLLLEKKKKTTERELLLPTNAE